MSSGQLMINLSSKLAAVTFVFKLCNYRVRAREQNIFTDVNLQVYRIFAMIRYPSTKNGYYDRVDEGRGN